MTLTSNLTDRAWYLIYSKPKAEKIAFENLQRQEFHVYLPFVKVTKRRQRKYIDIVEPMFPRYLFIQLNCTSDNWAPIRSTLGVSSIVRFGTYPMQVPASLIEQFKQNEDELGFQHVIEKEIKPGDKVQIIDGVMAGFEGIFEGENSKERVTILLNIAGQHTRVSMTRHDLELA
ncbi:MAG: transcription/translation regulatory transformer protein RfaH [Gammaproteobacteria bacterium]|nr:transcription/translation regulatory transformer protein RfaH [Gammaproteobacteria bacterium]